MSSPDAGAERFSRLARNHVYSIQRVGGRNETERRSTPIEQLQEEMQMLDEWQESGNRLRVDVVRVRQDIVQVNRVHRQATVLRQREHRHGAEALGEHLAQRTVDRTVLPRLGRSL